MFQSTHSLRSATIRQRSTACMPPVSIHALLAECDTQEAKPKAFWIVSIHALLAECDIFDAFVLEGGVWFQSTHSLRSATVRQALSSGQPRQFQSTHSLRSATPDVLRLVDMQEVSIHALLAECDQAHRAHAGGAGCFNPRTPCGVRRVPGVGDEAALAFQSTHSLRSATVRVLT